MRNCMNCYNPNTLGYVEVPTVNPQVTKMVIYGSLLVVGLAVGFYLWNRR